MEFLKNFFGISMQNEFLLKKLNYFRGFSHWRSVGRSKISQKFVGNSEIAEKSVGRWKFSIDALKFRCYVLDLPFDNFISFRNKRISGEQKIVHLENFVGSKFFKFFKFGLSKKNSAFIKKISASALPSNGGVEKLSGKFGRILAKVPENPGPRIPPAELVQNRTQIIQIRPELTKIQTFVRNKSGSLIGHFRNPFLVFQHNLKKSSKIFFKFKI